VEHALTLSPLSFLLSPPPSLFSRWNLDPLGFSNEHPFEQRTLQWGIMHMTRFQQKLQTLVSSPSPPLFWKQLMFMRAVPSAVHWAFAACLLAPVHFLQAW
jgi:hypothetical protein